MTVEIPDELLRRAQRVSGEGVTATVRRGLDLLARAELYRDVRALRGNVRFTIALEELRKDRD